MALLEIITEVTPNGRLFETELEKEVGQITEKVIRDVARFTPIEMRDALLNSPPTGRKYQLVSGEGFKRFHVASSKGNPPRNRSGDLSRSFKGRQTGASSGEISMIWYGKFHDERGRSFIEKSFDNAIEKAI